MSQETQDFAARYEQSPIEVPSVGITVPTAFVGPEGEGARLEDRTPVCLLHGFDGSSLEFRRLKPMLSREFPTWAVDLIGWGYSDSQAFVNDNELVVGPEEKREHLYNFWKKKIGKPMVLYGFSLGGAVAIDFALEYPEAVDRLVLQSSQGFIDGIGPLAMVPNFIRRLGVGLLKSRGLRKMATEMGYFDKTFANKDAIDVSCIHVEKAGWSEATVAFMRSGGYSISERVKDVKQPTLILWGREDEVLKPDFANSFSEEIPDSKLVWIDNCGHLGLLEKPKEIAQAVFEFMGVQ